MTVEYDSLRQEFLESLGFRVLRVTNDEVIKHLDEVRQTIVRHLTAILSPSPWTERGGEAGVWSFPVCSTREG